MGRWVQEVEYGLKVVIKSTPTFDIGMIRISVRLDSIARWNLLSDVPVQYRLFVKMPFLGKKNDLIMLVDLGRVSFGPDKLDPDQEVEEAILDLPS